MSVAIDLANRNPEPPIGRRCVNSFVRRRTTVLLFFLSYPLLFIVFFDNFYCLHSFSFYSSYVKIRGGSSAGGRL
jgi:hypothetical protein